MLPIMVLRGRDRWRRLFHSFVDDIDHVLVRHDQFENDLAAVRRNRGTSDDRFLVFTLSRFRARE